MKKTILAFLFILSYSSFSSDEQSSDFVRYKDNYCKNGNSKITSALISCNQEVLTSTVEQEDNISKVINSFIEVDFSVICDNQSKYSDRIKSYRDSNIELNFPPNPCICNLPELQYGGETFCSMKESDAKKTERDFKANIILDKLKNLEGLDEQSCVSEEVVSKCKSQIAKESIDFILNDFEFQEQDIVIQNNLHFLKELNSSNIKKSCEKDLDEKIQEICSLFATSNSKVAQIEDLDSSNLYITSKYADMDSTTNLEIYSCLMSKNIKKSVTNTVDLMKDIEPLFDKIITLPPPAEIAKLNEEHDIKISETDSVATINRKINNAVRKKEYERDVVRTQDIASELKTLAERLNIENNPVKRKEIFNRISNIKSELRTLSRTVPQKSNFSSISSIEKQYPKESKQYYAEIDNVPSNKKQDYSKNYQSAAEANKIIPIGNDNKSSQVRTNTSQDEYNPIYNRPEPKKAISIAGPVNSKEAMSSKDVDKKTAVSNFFGGAKNGPSRSPASASSPSSSIGSTSKTSPSASFIPIKSYEIETSSKQEGVINNGEFAKLKIVYIEDLKVMKLFKYKADKYKLEEELSKNDFLDSYLEFPKFVQEEGIKFFNIKSVKDLNDKLDAQ